MNTKSDPRKIKRVVIYTTLSCPYCDAAKKLLESKHVRFEEIDVTEDDPMRRRLVQMTGGRLTVPQIFLNGKSLGGYEDLVAFYGTGRTI